MATGRREATNGRSQHIFRKLEFAEPAQILDRSLRSEAVVANPKYRQSHAALMKSQLPR